MLVCSILLFRYFDYMCDWTWPWTVVSTLNLKELSSISCPRVREICILKLALLSFVLNERINKTPQPNTPLTSVRPTLDLHKTFTTSPAFAELTAILETLSGTGSAHPIRAIRHAAMSEWVSLSWVQYRVRHC